MAIRRQRRRRRSLQRITVRGRAVTLPATAEIVIGEVRYKWREVARSDGAGHHTPSDVHGRPPAAVDRRRSSDAAGLVVEDPRAVVVEDEAVAEAGLDEEGASSCEGRVRDAEVVDHGDVAWPSARGAAAQDGLGERRDGVERAAVLERLELRRRRDVAVVEDRRRAVRDRVQRRAVVRARGRLGRLVAAPRCSGGCTRLGRRLVIHEAHVVEGGVDHARRERGAERLLGRRVEFGVRRRRGQQLAERVDAWGAAAAGGRHDDARRGRRQRRRVHVLAAQHAGRDGPRRVGDDVDRVDGARRERGVERGEAQPGRAFGADRGSEVPRFVVVPDDERLVGVFVERHDADDACARACRRFRAAATLRAARKFDCDGRRARRTRSASASASHSPSVRRRRARVGGTTHFDDARRLGRR
mmetsp:Transcript_20068/g.80054  ORF Transcript_20068/g.80054 Transcript_20068/m.80054 type:complete len:415 (+) Transcript_20068:164-1408(+)